MAIESSSAAASPAAANPASILGAAVPRIDGPLKTSGTAMYSADFKLPRMVYAIPVCATIASGRIVSLDSSKAASMRGVLKVYSYGKMPGVYRTAPHSGRVGEGRPPLSDQVVSYMGQYVAVVVAETLDQARAAAAAVNVRYAEDKPNVARNLDDGFADNQLSVDNERGDVEKAFAAGPVTLDETYGTPVETHNPIELHAVVADWDGTNFTLYDTTQGVGNDKAAMAQYLGVPQEHVRIVMKFLGSGFGGKLFPWTHVPVAAAAARDLNRPVKFVVSRSMMFSNVGHRPSTVQRVRLSATPDGQLTSVQHDYVSDSSIHDKEGENCGEATPSLWASPNLRVRSAVVHRNIGTPTPMRGPGAVPGLYATESALDELAIKLNMDPVALRLKNDTLVDPSNGKPFSSRYMKECLTTGADRFGWSRRTPAVGSMKRDGKLIGWGVGCASWGAGRSGTNSNVSLNDDGTARVSCGTQDIGTGTYTVFAQTVHALTGVPMDRILVVLGDTRLPNGPMSGGSMVTGSVLPSISDGTKAATAQLLRIATSGPDAAFPNTKVDDLAFSYGLVHRKDSPPQSGKSFDSILRAAKVRAAEGAGDSPGLGHGSAADKYSFHSFGAHFAEVEYDPGIARLRVSRVVTVIDVGKIINERAARNQVEGAIVMGIGMALFEETNYDARTGKPTNDNLADYLVCSNPDQPEMDVTFTDHPDLHLSSFGARGVGEIGLAGIAPAINSAVYHATGVRKRMLPVRIEDLLQPLDKA